MKNKKNKSQTPKRNTRNWIIAAVLTATAGFFALQSRSATPENAALTPVELAAPTTTDTSAIHEGCAYTWAYKDAPELTEKFSALVKEINPEMEAHVNLYGEDCVYADGRRDFLVMESDFYVRIQVEDLNNYAALGDWMAKVMEAAIKIPKEEIEGNYGFVEFWFKKNEMEQTVIRVPIERYLNEGQGKSGEELFKLFITPIPL